jgi:hypothetical protein
MPFNSPVGLFEIVHFVAIDAGGKDGFDADTHDAAGTDDQIFPFHRLDGDVQKFVVVVLGDKDFRVPSLKLLDGLESNFFAVSPLNEEVDGIGTGFSHDSLWDDKAFSVYFLTDEGDRSIDTTTKPVANRLRVSSLRSEVFNNGGGSIQSPSSSPWQIIRIWCNINLDN